MYRDTTKKEKFGRQNNMERHEMLKVYLQADVTSQPIRLYSLNSKID